MGKGLVDRLQQEFALATQWLPLEIHPETPASGASLAQHLPHIDWDALYAQIRLNARPLGITFGPVSHLPNSRIALEAAEHARCCGRFDQFHETLFRAYFTDLEDIGDWEVIRRAAAETGIDPDELHTAVSAGQYRHDLQQCAAQARRLGIASVPAFIVANRYLVLGAQPLEQFQALLRRITADKNQ